jgi:hypothetical protein
VRDDEPLNTENSTPLGDQAALKGASVVRLSASESPAERAARERALKRLEKLQRRQTKAAKKAVAKAGGKPKTAQKPRQQEGGCA